MRGGRGGRGEREEEARGQGHGQKPKTQASRILALSVRPLTFSPSQLTKRYEDLVWFLSFSVCCFCFFGS